MKTPTLIITLDYELPGDGSGDVVKSIIEPTNRLLDLLGARRLKMTVFFEVEEYLVFKKYAKELKAALGYDPGLVIEEQLEKMVRSGHEIGLHVHPQWIGASYGKAGFNLFPQNLCLFDVFKNETDMTSYFRDRVATLENLVRKHDPNFEITSFRAGGLALRPEKITLKALGSLGVKIDSSVVKGLHRINKHINVDYRDVPPSKCYWYVDESVSKESPGGEIIELPIYSKMLPEFRKISANRIKMKFFSSGKPMTSISNGISEMALPKSPWGIIKHLFKKTPLKFDYCHMTKKEMLSFLNSSWGDELSDSEKLLTMIGHSKEFYNDTELDSFLDLVTGSELATFKTVAEVVTLIEASKK